MKNFPLGYTAPDAAYNHHKLRLSSGGGGDTAVTAKNLQLQNTFTKEAI
jgi:hypothetical protein